MAESYARRPSVNAVDLTTLMREPADSLGVFYFSDVRPLRGAAALLDWLLAGLLSQSLIRGACRGEWGEHTLIPTFGRLGQRRLFMSGLGASHALTSDRLASAIAQIQPVMRAAGGSHLALVAPAAPLPSQSSQDDPAVLALFLKLAEPDAERDGLRLLVERLQ